MGIKCFYYLKSYRYMILDHQDCSSKKIKGVEGVRQGG